MVSEPAKTVATDPDTPDSDVRSGDSNTLINALVGGVAGIVLFFIPFSTLLGGAVAGYLEGGETGDGLKVGAIAGLVMLVPFVFFGGLVLTFFFGIGGAPFAFLVFAFFAIVFAALYTVGLSALGGLLGVYLKNEL